MLPQEMSPIALRQRTLENKHLAHTHTLAHIENSFFLITLLSIGFTAAGLRLATALDLKIEDTRHCYSGYWSRFASTFTISAIVAVIQGILFYAYPYFRTLNQLEKNLINEKNVQEQQEKIKNNYKRYYNFFLMLLSVSSAGLISWKQSSFKSAYCDFLGINNQKCANVYSTLVNFSTEIGTTMRAIAENNPKSILPLDAKNFHNDAQKAIHILRDLYTPCSHLDYFRQCTDEALKFLDAAKNVQKLTQNHPHPFVQKVAAYIDTAVQQCIFPGMQSVFRYPTYPALYNNRILVLSLIVTSVMLFSAIFYIFCSILFPQLENYLDKNHFHHLTILLKGIEDISISRFVPGYYRTEIKGKKLDAVIAYDEIFFLLKKEGYNCDLQQEKVAIIKNLSLWGALSTKNPDAITSTTFKNKFYRLYDSRVTLLKLFETAIEQLNKLKTLIRSLNVTSMFYRMPTSFGYKITLNYSEKFEDRIFKEDLKKALGFIFLKVDHISQKLCITLEEQGATLYSKASFEKYAKAQAELEVKYGKEIDTITNSTQSSYRKRKAVKSSMVYETPVAKEKISNRNAHSQITDIENNTIYNIPKEFALPLSGAIFTVFNTHQNLLCYFLLLPQVINALQASEECQKFIDPVEKGAALQWVSLKGERGFSYCKQKSEQLNLKQYTNDKPVDVQYKDPKYPFRIWGESRKTTENLPFYTMHTLAEKTDDQGKKYRILSR